MQIVFLAFAGATGVLIRYCLDLLFFRFNKSFPFSTFLINILGSLLLGLLYILVVQKSYISKNWLDILGVGFLGGFTTFSAYSLQSVLLLNSKPFLGITYLILSPTLSVLAVWVLLSFFKSSV
jgi:CrcB protein